MGSYLVDTYALFEWYVDGNLAYRPYFVEMEGEESYTTHLTLLEFYHGVFHDAGKSSADEMLDLVLSYLRVVPLDIKSVKDAAIFRSEGLRTKKKYSYVDSANYVVARHLRVPFLTGDEAFRDVPNVAFVK
ncbi:MAG: PIN domain-containing protein [archaeon]